MRLPPRPSALATRSSSSRPAETVRFADDPASVAQEAAGARVTSDVLRQARHDLRGGAGLATTIAKYKIIHADDVKALMSEPDSFLDI